MRKLIITIIILTFAGTLFVYQQLPDRIPIHWDIQGQVNRYADKDLGAWLLPVLMVGLFGLFRLLPQLDPKKEKYKLFEREWEIIQTGLIVFFAYLQFIVLYLSLRPAVKMLPLMFIGLGLLFILLGNFLSKIRQNYFIGIKVPWTLASEDNWNKTHRFASWCFVVAGILTLAEAYFLNYAPVVIISSLTLAGILPIIYSLLLYKKQSEKMKYIFAGLAVILVGIIFVRLI